MFYPCNPEVVAWTLCLLFLGCLYCFAKPAVMHCLGANRAACSCLCQAVLGYLSLQASG